MLHNHCLWPKHQCVETTFYIYGSLTAYDIVPASISSLDDLPQPESAASPSIVE